MFFTEASHEIGYGHLMECMAIAEKCSDFSDISFYLNNSDSKAINTVADKGFSVLNNQDFFDDIYIKFPRKFDWILLNTRNNSYSLQEKLIIQTDHFIILDELGHKHIKCHSLINFSINEQWHKYDFIQRKPSLFLGTDYYPMREILRDIPKNIPQKDGSVLVTLGGADRTNTTLRLAQMLGGLKDLDCTYVIGPGSSLEEEDIYSILSSSSGQKVVKSPLNFDELMISHHFIIAAGGNTLYEAAFLGKRILIVWEDEHEKIQGELFEQKGLARIVGGPDFLDYDLMLQLITGNKDRNTDKMKTDKMKNNTDIIDGKGLQRIASIIEKSQA